MRVGLYPTCAVDLAVPQVGIAAVRVLERLGISVIAPNAASCCGQPAYNAGHWRAARTVAEGFLAVVEELLARGAEYVLLPSGSCTGMALHGYASLFEGDSAAARAAALTGRVRELSQFLVGDLGVEDVGARYSARATYHPSCHGRRILGISDEPLRLLSRVRGLTLVELPYAQDCCGFGGTFAVKLPDVSGAMVAEKARHIAECQADVLITNDMGCGMNIAGRLAREGAKAKVRHWVEILAGE